MASQQAGRSAEALPLRWGFCFSAEEIEVEAIMLIADGGERTEGERARGGFGLPVG